MESDQIPSTPNAPTAKGTKQITRSSFGQAFDNLSRNSRSSRRARSRSSRRGRGRSSRRGRSHSSRRGRSSRRN